MPADQDKIATLRQAAAAKREAATARAETGIRKLTKTGQPVTFRGVAAASGVSVDFLYRHPELRARIERLRGRQPAPAGRSPASEPGSPGASSVVATLTARLAGLGELAYPGFGAGGGGLAFGGCGLAQRGDPVLFSGHRRGLLACG